MAERNRAAVRIDDAKHRHSTELTGHRERLCRECLVQLDHIDVRNLDPMALNNFRWLAPGRFP